MNVEILSKVTAKYPQSTYTALTYSLQAEWQYLSRVMPLASEALSPDEAAIHSKFLPALLGIEPIDDNIRSFLSNGVKHAGNGISNTTTTSDILYSSSCSAMNLLVENSQLDFIEHKKMFNKQAQATNNPKLTLNSKYWTQCQKRHGQTIQQRLLCASRSGAWLTVMPNRQHGTTLNTE